MVNVHRRRMRLNTLRKRYTAEHGHGPCTDQGFLDWANTEQARTHKNPAQLGMVFTPADLLPIEAVLSTDADGGESMAVTEDDPDAVLSPLDRKRLARLVIERAAGVDPTLHRCAHAVFGPQASDHPELVPEPGQVARELGVKAARADALMGEVTTLAREILAAEFGITARRP
jgi:hypothetical protein